MVLPVGRFSLPTDDCSRDLYRRDRAAQVQVADADREHFPDPCRGADEHFNDLTELPVWSRPGDDGPLFPRAHGLTDECDVGVLECIRCSGRSSQPRDVIHRVPRDRLMPHGEAEREPENNPRLSGAVVTLLRKLLQEVVTARNADFAERELIEGRRDEGAHVAFIEQSGGTGESVFDFHVFEPVVHKRGELVVRTEADETGLEEGALGELALQGELSRGLRGTSALDGTEFPIPVTVAGTGLAATFADLAVADLPERPDRRAGPSHAALPLQGSGAGGQSGRMGCAGDF